MNNKNITSFKELTYFTRVTVIPTKAFMSSSLVYIEIPDRITTLENNAFQGTNLVNVVLPESVASIGDSCFRDNSSRKLLKTLTMLSATPPTLVSLNAFTGQADCIFYVPTESVDAYKAAPVWSSLSSRIYAIP